MVTTGQHHFSQSYYLPPKRIIMIYSCRLGVIMNILHGANFAALWGGFKYVYGICSTTKRTSYKPPILRRVMLILALGLGLVHSFVILVIALSISSRATSFSQLREYSGTWPQLSRQ